MIDFPGEEAHVPQHLASWIYYCREIEVTGRHLMKHGCEEKKVLTIDQGEFDGRIVGQSFLQLHGDCETRKTPAENEYPLWRIIFHRTSPTTLVRQSEASDPFPEFVGWDGAAAEKIQNSGPNGVSFRLRRGGQGAKLRLVRFTHVRAEPMSFLPEVALSEDFQPFARFHEDFGFIPNLFRAQSLLPRVIEAQAAFEKAVRLNQGAISRVQKERILLCVAADRRDVYCAGLARTALLLQGEPVHRIEGLLQDHTCLGLSAPEVALLDFCRKLASRAISVSSVDIERLRQFGIEDESLIEAVVTTALGIYRCTLSVGLQPKPENDPWNLPAGTQVSVPEAGRSARPPAGPYVGAPYLSPLTFEAFGTLMKSHGFIPNFFRAQTLRPDLLAAEAELTAAILLPADPLTRSQKESILLAVSAANLNSYCVAVHCNLLRGLGLPAEEGDQIAIDHHGSSLSEADKALLDFAIKLGTRFSEFSLDDIDRLRAAGFSDPQILECQVVTALNNFANFLQAGLGIGHDFDPPLAFERKKAHLTAVSDRPNRAGFGCLLCGGTDGRSGRRVDGPCTRR